MLAYAMYADDFGGSVLPGYPPASWVQGPNRPRNQLGEPIEGREVASRYPWRLAPYFDGDLNGLYQDLPLPNSLNDSPVGYDYLISLYPSFGLNSYFVGGHDGEGQAFNPIITQQLGTFWVRRDSQVRRPTDLIVFASARRYATNAEAGFFSFDDQHVPGYFKITPPRFVRALGERWESTYNPHGVADGDYGRNSGHVDLRHNDKAIVALFDGHSESLAWDELRDMRRWADQADAPDWGLGPDSP